MSKIYLSTTTNAGFYGQQIFSWIGHLITNTSGQFEIKVPPTVIDYVNVAELNKKRRTVLKLVCIYCLLTEK